MAIANAYVALDLVQVRADSWLCARVGGPDYAPVAHHDVWSRGIFAHTSPIYLPCGQDWTMADPAALNYLQPLVSGSLEYIRGMSQQWAPGTVSHHHGEADH